MRISGNCSAKQPVVSTTTSWIFTATPYIVFASTVTAGLLVPIFVSQMPLNFAGNIIAFVYLLALGTFFLILAGLDAGSAFGGMGSSREAIVASLTEPAMIMSIFAIALTAGSTNLSTIVHKTALVRRDRNRSLSAFDGARRPLHCGHRRNRPGSRG